MNYDNASESIKLKLNLTIANIIKADKCWKEYSDGISRFICEYDNNNRKSPQPCGWLFDKIFDYNNELESMCLHLANNLADVNEVPNFIEMLQSSNPPMALVDAIIYNHHKSIKYPIRKVSINTGMVVEFLDIDSGVVIDPKNNPYCIGQHLEDLFDCTDTTKWAEAC